MILDSRVEDRQQRRYLGLACRHLPAWAVPIFAKAFCDALTSVVRVRRVLRGADEVTSNNGVRDKRLKAAERRYLDRVKRIVRLCTYDNVDMENAWRSLPSPRAGDVASFMIDEINEVVERFETLPKRTASVRKKSLLSASRTAENLLSQIESDPELFELASDALDLYLWTRRGTKNSISSIVSGAVVEHTMFLDMLKFFRTCIDDLVVAKTHIAHPGRDDEGLKPYLIRELSKLMQIHFDKPLDRTVALFVSAIMNLPVQLGRDDVTPYTRRRGKISV